MFLLFPNMRINYERGMIMGKTVKKDMIHAGGTVK